MAIIKSAIKSISTVLGEVLVVGGALGTAYVLGFIKGSEVKPELKGVIDGIDKKIKEATEKKPETTEEEPAEENSEPESENEEVGPSIEVTHNNQAED